MTELECFREAVQFGCSYFRTKGAEVYVKQEERHKDGWTEQWYALPSKSDHVNRVAASLVVHFWKNFLATFGVEAEIKGHLDPVAAEKIQSQVDVNVTLAWFFAVRTGVIKIPGVDPNFFTVVDVTKLKQPGYMESIFGVPKRKDDPPKPGSASNN